MLLILHVAGAEPAALERGVVAAQEILNDARVTAAEGVLGRWASKEWQRSGATRATAPDGIQRAAAAFALAEAAAIDTCCRGRPAPWGSWLEASGE